MKFFIGYIALTAFMGIVCYRQPRITKPVTFGDIKTASGKPMKQALMELNLEMFNAGCTYPLNRLKQINPKYYKGDPQTFCGPATEAARKQLEGIK